ncbi:AMP nucleosidase [Ewingella americana]|uniref:AMP nucleosidase n=2 Tax=Ewingella americana TaxID=41202 RepID=A0A377TEB2_9GAMM|nr:AMP nucleosidase [Ewingella americana]
MPYFVLSLAHLHKGTILNNAYSATQLNATEALDRLEALYNGAVVALRTAIGDFIHDGSLPDNDVRSAGLFTYPELSVSWDGAQQNQF